MSKDCKYEKSNRCMHFNKCLCPEKLTVRHKLTTNSLCCLNEAHLHCLNCVGHAKVKCIKCCEEFSTRTIECSGRASVGSLNCRHEARVEELEITGDGSAKCVECLRDFKSNNIDVKELHTKEYKCDGLTSVNDLCVNCDIKTQSLDVDWKLKTKKLVVEDTMTSGSINVCENAKLEDICNPQVFGQIVSSTNNPATTIVINNVWTLIPVVSITGENGPGFSFLTPSELIYDGSVSRYIESNATVSLYHSSGTVDVPSVFDVAIFKNGVFVPNAIASLTVNLSATSTFMFSNSTEINKILRMGANDYLELYIRRTSGDSQVSVDFILSAESLPNLVV